MDATGFGIGLYNDEDKTIDFHAFIENGEILPFDSDELTDLDRLSVWCFLNQEEVFINDYSFEFRSYISQIKAPKIGKTVESVIYLPLSSKGKRLGVITVQSFQKHAYSEYHLNILRNLAVYTTIAIENYETFHLVEEEREKSENLLLNILPKETAEELKEHGKATSKYYEKASVLFTDFKGFTKIAEKMSPEELVAELDHCFRAFDRIVKKYKLEKIKTIGDAYMCAGGLPIANESNPVDAVNAALEMMGFIEQWKNEKLAIKEKTGKFVPMWDIRIGIHTGSVVAGIVGENKFAYDIWGDAVNTASRMESAGEANHVNISGATYAEVKDVFKCVYRGKIHAKNKGEIDMYFVEGLC
jgi:class 3 adenylate cyclase